MAIRRLSKRGVQHYRQFDDRRVIKGVAHATHAAAHRSLAANGRPGSFATETRQTAGRATSAMPPKATRNGVACRPGSRPVSCGETFGPRIDRTNYRLRPCPWGASALWLGAGVMHDWGQRLWQWLSLWWAKGCDNDPLHQLICGIESRLTLANAFKVLLLGFVLVVTLRIIGLKNGIKGTKEFPGLKVRIDGHLQEKQVKIPRGNFSPMTDGQNYDRRAGTVEFSEVASARPWWKVMLGLGRQKLLLSRDCTFIVSARRRLQSRPDFRYSRNGRKVGWPSSRRYFNR